MKKELEDYLWNNIGYPSSRMPLARNIINEMVSKGMIQNAKQAHRTLEKWSRKGIYDYGCCLDLGWKKDKD